MVSTISSNLTGSNEKINSYSDDYEEDASELVATPTTTPRSDDVGPNREAEKEEKEVVQNGFVKPVSLRSNQTK